MDHKNYPEYPLIHSCRVFSTVWESNERSSTGSVSQTQTTLDTAVKPRYCSESRAKEISERILLMIALDLRPVRVVEGHGFKDLMHYLEPRYTIPSRKHFTKLLRHKHSLGKEKLCSKFEEADSIALTTDIWTSAATEAYITVTAHYLDLEWKLHAFVLQTAAFPERHTGVEIATKLKQICDDFGIGEKVSAIVHDRAANMMLTLDILEAERSWENLSCSAHNLQLCLKAGFDIPAICACKLVGHFHHSVVATEALKRKQSEMNVVGKKLFRDCVTQWNSSYFMLDRLVKLRWPVTAVLSHETDTKRSDQFLDLKTEQWNISAELLKVLEPFDIATTFFSYEENPSMSCVLPVLHGLMEKLSSSSDDLTEVRQFKQKVKAEITRRWSFDSLDGDNILVLGCILDPCFKQVKFLSDDGKESVK